MMQNRRLIGLVLLLVGSAGTLMFVVFRPQVFGIDEAVDISERYLASLANSDLAIDEIMEFEQNFYIMYYEESTEIGAFEMLIDKVTGRILPEYGPNMMWNTKYGHSGMMVGWSQVPSEQMPINHDEAILRAQEFLNQTYQGTMAEDAHQFYGYYTIHAIKDGKIYGMLSVNGYDGAVWYHNWHGMYIQSRETHESQ